MHEMVFAVRDLMLDAYPELGESARRVADVIRSAKEEKGCRAKGWWSMRITWGRGFFRFWIVASLGWAACVGVQLRPDAAWLAVSSLVQRSIRANSPSTRGR